MSVKRGPWGLLRELPQPKKGPFPSSKRADRDRYDLMHRAWRAGVLDNFGWGKRSPEDSTIIWQLDGFEYPPTAIDTHLPRMIAAAGIERIEWGSSWIGFREVIVTYADGRRLVERCDGLRAVVEAA